MLARASGSRAKLGIALLVILIIGFVFVQYGVDFATKSKHQQELAHKAEKQRQISELQERERNKLEAKRKEETATKQEQHKQDEDAKHKAEAETLAKQKAEEEEKRKQEEEARLKAEEEAKKKKVPETREEICEDQMLKTASTPVLANTFSEHAFTLVIDTIIFDLQANAHGVSNVWIQLIPEFYKLIKPPSRLLLLQRGRDMKNRFCWDHLPMMPAGQALPERVIFMSSYYGHEPGRCNVLVAYDCIPENFGMAHGPGTEYYPRVDGIQRWANSIVSIANSTTNDMLRIYGIDPKIIGTTHTRINGDNYKQASQEQVDAFKAAHGIDKPYFLLIGNRWFFKNTDVFFQAVAKLTDEEREQFIVVAAGGDNFGAQEVANLKNAKRVYIGYVPYEQIPTAFTGALATVYLSFYEGFGMPVPESMACGGPVICGNEWPFADDVVLKVDKKNPDDVAAAIRKALQPGFKSPERIKRLKEEARSYGVDPKQGWNKMAYDILNHVINGPHRGPECDFLQKQP